MSIIHSGGSKGGARGSAPLPRVQTLSISCSFLGILAKSYVGAPPPPGELAPPPRGNPGSATYPDAFFLKVYSYQPEANVKITSRGD